MVERAVKFVTRELSGLHEAAFLLGFFALLSQIIGLLRDRILASHFGAGGDLDLYYAAFRIPDFLYVSVASFVASTALIPFIYQKREEGETALREYLSRLWTTFTVGMLAVILLTWFFLPSITSILVPGFSEKMMREYVWISRLLLFSPFFLGLSNLFGSISQSSRRFFSYALAPIVYNIGIVFGAYVLTPFFGITGVVYGVILGTIAHAAIQIPTLFSEQLFPKFGRFSSFREIRALLFLSLPRTLALAAHQIAMMILIALASKINIGSIAIFTLATNLHNIPLMIVGSSYAVAAFPTLAKLYHDGKTDGFLIHIGNAIRHIIFWSIPAIIFFIVIRAQVVRTILGSGAFDWTATRLTASALAILILSLTAHSLVLLFARGYYAMGDTRHPLYFNTFGASAMIFFSYVLITLYEKNIVFQYFFEHLLRVEDIEGTKILMIALAYTAGMFLSLLCYIVHFRGRFTGFFIRVQRTLLHAFTASIGAGYVSYHLLQLSAPLLDTQTAFGIFFQGLLSGLGGIIFWIVLLRILHNSEIEEITRAFRDRFWKSTRPIAGEPEEI